LELWARSSRFGHAEPKTALSIDESRRHTALLSLGPVVPQAYRPVKENDGRILFPIDTFRDCLRVVSASQASFAILCAIDVHGERALKGEQPGSDLTLLILTKSKSR